MMKSSHQTWVILLESFACKKLSTYRQGSQKVYCQTKNPNLGKFWRVLHWKMLVYFYGRLIYFPRFGMLYKN
jgi:hypothetical protein